MSTLVAKPAVCPCCERCRFWFPWDDQRGECRRRSPITLGRSERHIQGVNDPIWPTTKRTDICGDFIEIPPPMPAD